MGSETHPVNCGESVVSKGLLMTVRQRFGQEGHGRCHEAFRARPQCMFSTTETGSVQTVHVEQQSLEFAVQIMCQSGGGSAFTAVVSLLGV